MGLSSDAASTIQRLPKHLETRGSKMWDATSPERLRKWLIRVSSCFNQAPQNPHDLQKSQSLLSSVSAAPKP